MQQIERYGALIPSSNTTVEDELAQYLRLSSRESVRFHVARLDYQTRFSVSYQSYCQEICASVTSAMSAVKKIKNITKIGFFCTTASIFLYKDLFSSLENPISAIKKVCSAKEILSPLIITPYTDEITNKILNEMPLLTGVSPISLNKLTASELNEISQDTLFELIKFNFDFNRHDSTIILCTNLPSFHLAKKVRYFTNKPFVSSNLAMISAMQNIEIDQIIEQMLPI